MRDASTKLWTLIVDSNSVTAAFFESKGLPPFLSMASITQLKSLPNTRFSFAYADNTDWTDPLGKGFVEKDHLVHKYSQRLCLFHQLMFLWACIFHFYRLRILWIVTLRFGFKQDHYSFTARSTVASYNFPSPLGFPSFYSFRWRISLLGGK